MSLTIGLTGGIASGKSLVQREFEMLGVPVLDADQVSREVVAPGSIGLSQIAAEFGAAFIAADGQLDRRRLRERVFGDTTALRRLEAITHPLIRTSMRAWLAAQTTPYCILSVAILVEARMHDLVDRVLVVDTPPELQLARLQQRDGIDLALAQRMLAAQATRETRLAAAADLIINDGELAPVRDAVTQLHGFYLQLAANSDPRAPGLRLPASANSVTIKV